eukprot:UN18419
MVLCVLSLEENLFQRDKLNLVLLYGQKLRTLTADVNNKVGTFEDFLPETKKMKRPLLFSMCLSSSLIVCSPVISLFMKKARWNIKSVGKSKEIVGKIVLAAF